MDHADEHGRVERPVETSVASAIETMPGGVARGCGDGADAGEGSEGGLGAHPAGVGPRGEHDCSGDRPNPGDLKKRSGGAGLNQSGHAIQVRCQLLGEFVNATGETDGLFPSDHRFQGFIC